MVLAAVSYERIDALNAGVCVALTNITDYNISFDEAKNGTFDPFICYLLNNTNATLTEYWWICNCDEDDCDLCWLLLLLLCCCLVPLAVAAKRKKDEEEEDELPVNNFTRNGTLSGPKQTPMMENPMFDDPGDYIDPVANASNPEYLPPPAPSRPSQAAPLRKPAKPPRLQAAAMAPPAQKARSMAGQPSSGHKASKRSEAFLASAAQKAPTVAKAMPPRPRKASLDVSTSKDKRPRKPKKVKPAKRPVAVPSQPVLNFTVPDDSGNMYSPATGTYAAAPAAAPMRLNVETVEGDVLTVDVQPSDTVAEIKNRLHQAGAKDFNIPEPELQKLEFKGGVLDNDASTLEDCGVQTGDTIKMLPSQIFVETLEGDIVPVFASPADTIADVKDRVNEIQGIPPALQNLTFQGVPLDIVSTGAYPLGFSRRTWRAEGVES